MDTYEHVWKRQSSTRRFAGRLKAAAVIAIVLAGAAVLHSCGRVEAREFQYEYDAEVLRIVDGDTYVMRLHIYPGAALTQHVRLDEWDTPERRGKCSREKQMAAEAAIAAGLWFGRAGDMVRAYLSDVDAFGRPIVRLVSPEGSLGDALAAAGLALPFKRGRTEKWCAE